MMRSCLLILALLVFNPVAADLLDEESEWITRYKPMYFIYGVPTTKVHLSFKYQLVKSWPMFIGYNQIMFWDLLKDSIPFRDINYNPELFYRMYLAGGWVSNIDFGYEHLSNGRDNQDSRAIDRLYIEPHLTGGESQLGWNLAVRLRMALRRDHEAPDYDQLSGNAIVLSGQLTRVFSGVFDQGTLHFKLTPGGTWLDRLQYGSQEVGFSFRLGGLNLTPSIFVQYFHGYAESMLEYKEEVSHLRAGILL